MKRYLLVLGLILVALLIFGCCGATDGVFGANPNIEKCEQESSEFNRDLCYFDLIKHHNYSSASEGHMYCNKIKNWQLWSACDKLVYYN